MNFVGTNFNGGYIHRAAMLPSSIEEAFCIVVDKGPMNDVGNDARLCDRNTYYQGQFSLSIVLNFVTGGLSLILAFLCLVN